MNLSFSTRGWQDIDWEQQLSTAVTMRFGGVEVYNVHKDAALTGRGGPFDRYNAAATVRKLREKKTADPVLRHLMRHLRAGQSRRHSPHDADRARRARTVCVGRGAAR